MWEAPLPRLNAQMGSPSRCHRVLAIGALVSVALTYGVVFHVFEPFQHMGGRTDGGCDMMTCQKKARPEEPLES